MRVYRLGYWKRRVSNPFFGKFQLAFRLGDWQNEIYPPIVRNLERQPISMVDSQSPLALRSSKGQRDE